MDTALANSQSGDEAFQRTEFYAEDEQVEISPMVRSGVVSLVCGNFGPFEPSVTAKVPLWLALALKKVHRCKILQPRWMTPERLREYIAQETENEENLHEIPFYFFEVASLLLHYASDDIENAPQIRRYIEDIANVRDSKMRKWMQVHVRDRVNAIKINNLTLHEVHVHRPVLTEILNNLYSLHVDPSQQSSLSETVTTTNSVSEAGVQPAQARRLRRVIRRD